MVDPQAHLPTAAAVRPPAPGASARPSSYCCGWSGSRRPRSWRAPRGPAPVRGPAAAARGGRRPARRPDGGPRERAPRAGPRAAERRRAILLGASASAATAILTAAVGILALLTGLDGVVWDGRTGAVLVLLAALVGAGALAVHLHADARDRWPSPSLRPEPGDPGAAGVRPDVLDDVATLVARAWPGSSPARTAAWFVRGLDVWSWSPRRHRRTFVLLRPSWAARCGRPGRAGAPAPRPTCSASPGTPASAASCSGRRSPPGSPGSASCAPAPTTQP